MWNVPVDDAGVVEILEREDDLAEVEADLALLEAPAVLLQVREELAAALVVDHEEEVRRGLKAGVSQISTQQGFR